MTGSLGIDHPLILVRDIALASTRYQALGFRMTPVTRHPWGTSTAVAVFDRCLIELMSVYDEALIDVNPAGDFRFGRIVRDHLAEREGVSLTALNSDDAEADAAALQVRGVACQGTIEFGRDVVLPDGRRDRTATTLKILHAPEMPRLSNFICQQHRRDLIQSPAWMDHPNGAYGIAGVTILATPADRTRVLDRLAALYGRSAIFATADVFGAHTGNGDFVVVDHDAALARHGAAPSAVATGTTPCIVAIDVRVRCLEDVRPFLGAARVPHRESAGSILLTEATSFGNVFLSFVSPASGGPQGLHRAARGHGREGKGA